jgi:hypothetical protein
MLLKTLSFLLCITLSLPGLCQEETSQITTSEESAAEEVAAYRQTQARGHKSLEQAAESLELANQVEAMSKEGITASSLMDEKVQATLQNLFSQGLFEKESREETKGRVLENVKGKRIEKIFQRFPRLLDLVTDVIRDREAMPGLIRVMGRKSDLRKYFQIWVSLLIFSFLFRRFWLKKRITKQGFLSRTVISLGFSLFMTSLSLMIFYSMFKSDVRPTVSIIANYL